MNNYDHTKFYAFEYNETNGTFHQNFGEHIQNTKGYKTVYEGYDFIWDPFSNWIRKRYSFNRGNHPSFDIVMQEWESYIKLREDIEKYNKTIKY